MKNFKTLYIAFAIILAGIALATFTVETPQDNSNLEGQPYTSAAEYHVVTNYSPYSNVEEVNTPKRVISVHAGPEFYFKNKVTKKLAFLANKYDLNRIEYIVLEQLFIQSSQTDNMSTDDVYIQFVTQGEDSFIKDRYPTDLFGDYTVDIRDVADDYGIDDPDLIELHVYQ